MSQIVDWTKNYEFRKYCLKPSVKRIWFYRTAPHSALTHICEILPARTRNPGDPPLEENGSGNAEFNNRHQDWGGYDFAYKIVSVYELRHSIPLATMRSEYGFKAATRGLVYLPQVVVKHVAWRQQKLISGRRKREQATRWRDCLRILSPAAECKSQRPLPSGTNLSSRSSLPLSSNGLRMEYQSLPS